MVDQEGKKDEDKVEFDSAGQAIEYISMDQAHVLAIAETVTGKSPRPHVPAGLGVIGLVIGVLLLAACEETAQRPGTSAVAPAPVVSAPVTVRVLPDTPTELVSPLGDVKVVIPAGSVADASELSYWRVERERVPPAPTGFVLSDKVFDISITDSSQSEGGPVKLNRPITVTVSLSP